MKSVEVVMVDKNKLELQEEIIDERKIKSNEVLIKNLYSVISAGTELANYTALDKGVWEKGSWNAYPYIPGYGAVGEVVSVGKDNSSRLTAGEKVFYIGKHVSLERYDRGFWVKPPEGISLQEAAFMRMAMVAMTALNRAEFLPGNTVVVVGLGVIGNIAAQLFSIAGCDVIGLDLSEKRVQLARQCNVKHTANLSGKQAIDFVMEITKGQGADVAVEAVGDSRICENTINMVKKLGEMIILGSPRADYQTNLTPFLRKIHLEWVTVKGALEWCVPDYPATGFKHSLQSNYLRLCDFVIKKKLNIKPLISHVVPAREADKAYQGLLNKKDEYVGVLLDWTKEVL